MHCPVCKDPQLAISGAGISQKSQELLRKSMIRVRFSWRGFEVVSFAKVSAVG